MDYEGVVGAILVALLLFFSLDFDKPYAAWFHDMARQPFARFLAGLAVAYASTYNATYGMLALIVVFFWIADVHLLSSVKL